MRRKLLARVVLTVALAAAGTAAQAAPLTVRVLNVSPKGGDLRISLYDRAGYEGHDAPAVFDLVVSARAPATEAVFAEVPPGVYAIKMFQDANRNGRFDFTWIGLPAERYGFSRDARPLFDQPAFDKAQFTMDAAPRLETMHLQ